jgi:ABC-type sugar transport system ATPase subunit
VAIAFISHQLHEVGAISTRIVVVRGGQAVGNTPTAILAA